MLYICAQRDGLYQDGPWFSQIQITLCILLNTRENLSCVIIIIIIIITDIYTIHYTTTFHIVSFIASPSTEILSDGMPVSTGTSTIAPVFRQSELLQQMTQKRALEILILETVWCVRTRISEMLVPSLTVRLRAVYYPIKRHKRRLNQTAVVKCRRGISREYSTGEQTDLCKTEAGRVYDNPIHRSTNKVQ